MQAPIHGHDLFRALVANALRIDGPEIERLCATARRHGIVVSMGFTEGTVTSVGCIWNSNVLIGADGTILNHHRMRVPTFYEKLIWANGDGHGLRVADTPIGRIGALICGENTNPLARFALMAQREPVHIASYPPVCPTRAAAQGNYDLEQATKICAGAHSFEAKVFTVVAAPVLDKSARTALAGLSAEAQRVLDQSPIVSGFTPAQALLPDFSNNGADRDHRRLTYIKACTPVVAENNSYYCISPRSRRDVPNR